MSTSPDAEADTEREAERQQQLLAAIRDGEPAPRLTGWLRDDAPRARRGLQAYRANVLIGAERALADSFPTLRELVGDEAFGALVRAYWHRRPPTCGDLAWYGADLPEFIATDPHLADEPYLADCARIDWALHRIEAAADAAMPVRGLETLAEVDPSHLWLRLQPGLVVLASRWPVVRIHAAHEVQRHATDFPGKDRYAEVRDAMADGESQIAMVWRDGWRGRVDAIDDATAAFTVRLQEGGSLADALSAAGADFNFEAWLILLMSRGRSGVRSIAFRTAASHSLLPLARTSFLPVIVPSKAQRTSTTASGLPLTSPVRMMFGLIRARIRPA
jgi:hypothetical protein